MCIPTSKIIIFSRKYLNKHWSYFWMHGVPQNTFWYFVSSPPRHSYHDYIHLRWNQSENVHRVRFHYKTIHIFFYIIPVYPSRQKYKFRIRSGILSGNINLSSMLQTARGSISRNTMKARKLSKFVFSITFVKVLGCPKSFFRFIRK